MSRVGSSVVGSCSRMCVMCDEHVPPSLRVLVSVCLIRGTRKFAVTNYQAATRRVVVARATDRRGGTGFVTSLQSIQEGSCVHLLQLVVLRSPPPIIIPFRRSSTRMDWQRAEANLTLSLRP